MKQAIFFLFFFFLGCASTDSHRTVPTFSLEELEKRTFDYFMATMDTVHYQVLDRYPTRTFYSIAATGFGYAALPIGVEKKYITRDRAAHIALHALRQLAALPQNATSDASGYKGFYYHFLDLKQAKRYKDVELSSIDTGLLMAGVLTLQSYFDRDNPQEKEIRNLADAIYRKVEWDWMLNDKGLLSHGWKPESGFIKHDWEGYNEAMILLILAMGSPTHPIPDTCWANWTQTYEWLNFQGEKHLNFAPLFGHQYSQAFIDFRGIQDDFMRKHSSDYFINSRKATYANRAYCIQNPKNFKGYSENIWGLTACDGPGHKRLTINDLEYQFDGYSARGASAKYV
ncbi:MAG TPA: Tat pathway signal protein, partial [Saprospiraceae bacterium]|nr:Tat pathway signal protein [Saprospiraceae bacterium]